VTTTRGGWNRRAPAGAVRCDCPTRRERWAYLDPEAGQPCCARPCCRAERASLVSSREQVTELRHRLLREQARCPRCGEAIARHWRNFLCVDPLTRRIREVKARRPTRTAGAAGARRRSPTPR
jgi:hypothetical protein